MLIRKNLPPWKRVFHMALAGTLSLGGGSALVIASPLGGMVSSRHPFAVNHGLLHSADRGLVDTTTQLDAITTDTGSFAPGNTDFSRFTVIGECIAAALNTADGLSRTLPLQLVRSTVRDSAPELDTLPTGAVIVARNCGKRFTMDNTAAGELTKLLTLALLENDDSLASAVVRRRVALAPDSTMKHAVLEQAVTAYLTARPARISAAGSVVAQVDAFGEQAQAERVVMHGMLLAFARSIMDRDRMRDEANTILSLVQHGTRRQLPHARDALAAAYQALMEIAYIEHSDSLQVISHRAQRDINAWPKTDDVPADVTADKVKNNWPLTPPFQSPEMTAGTLPPLTAAYWFPRKPEVWPAARGQGALIFNAKVPVNSYLPQWLAKYGDRLAVTIVSTQIGSAPWSVKLPAVQEADSIAWFYRTYLKLPVTVAFIQDSVWQLPTPDGRQFLYDTAFYGQHRYDIDSRTGQPRKHSRQFDVDVLFFARDGTLRYDGKFDPAVLRVVLAHDMAPRLGAVPLLPGHSAVQPHSH